MAASGRSQASWSHDCALDLHGQYSAPTPVRATWWLIWRPDGPDSTPDRSLSTSASAQVNGPSHDFARALNLARSLNEVFSPGIRDQLKGAVDAAGQACSESSGTSSAAPRNKLPPGGIRRSAGSW